MEFSVLMLLDEGGGATPDGLVVDVVLLGFPVAVGSQDGLQADRS